MTAAALGWRDLLTFLSPAGQQELVEFVRQAKREGGSNWLPAVKNEFPAFSWMVELVATKTDEEAYAALQAAYPHYPLYFVKNQIKSLHGVLLAEIEKKR